MTEPKTPQLDALLGCPTEGNGVHFSYEEVELVEQQLAIAVEALKQIAHERNTDAAYCAIMSLNNINAMKEAKQA